MPKTKTFFTWEWERFHKMYNRSAQDITWTCTVLVSASAALLYPDVSNLYTHIQNNIKEYLIPNLNLSQSNKPEFCEPLRLYAEVIWNWGPLPIKLIKAPRLIQPKAKKKRESFPGLSHLSCRPLLSASPGRTRHPTATCLCPRCQRKPSCVSAAECSWCLRDASSDPTQWQTILTLFCNPLFLSPSTRSQWCRFYAGFCPSAPHKPYVSLPPLSLSLPLSLSPFLSLGSAQPLFLSFLLFSPPPPLCVSFEVNGACGRRSLGLSRALWECGVTWPRTGRTFWVGPGTHPLPVPFPWLLCTPCHRPDCTRTLTVWLALVAQRHRLHLYKGPATP